MQPCTNKPARRESFRSRPAFSAGHVSARRYPRELSRSPIAVATDCRFRVGNACGGSCSSRPARLAAFEYQAACGTRVNPYRKRCTTALATVRMEGWRQELFRGELRIQSHPLQFCLTHVLQSTAVAFAGESGRSQCPCRAVKPLRRLNCPTQLSLKFLNEESRYGG